MSLMTLLFSFQGRINRARYWKVLLIYSAVLVVCLIVAFIGIAVSTAAPSISAFVKYLVIALFGIVCMFGIWSSIAAGIRRLHDRDVSGWWLLVFSAVSTIVSLLQETAVTSSSKTLLDLASFMVTVWITIELGCLRGTHGPNRFGPDLLEGLQR